MTYTGFSLSSDIEIRELYTVYYFEFSKKYLFEGESHNFWELVYVDKGEITVVADNSEHLLSQGDIIFHKPNEWHELKATGTVAPNIVVMSFSSDSAPMEYFKSKILSINQNQKKIISRIIAEYSNAFLNPLNIKTGEPLHPRKNSPIGSQQLLKNSICELLISLVRSSKHPTEQTYSTRLNHSNTLLSLILNYMQSNIHTPLRLEDIIKYSGSNKTTITSLFKEEYGMGAIEYFINLKIEQAKSLLREEAYNITQISEILGYSGIHYFSRQFKKTTGMSPSEYARSVNAMLPPPQKS